LEKHGENIIPKSSWYKREKETIRRFQNVAHLHLPHLPAKDDCLSWLALMQHYGGPTRLLDFTFNPIVAMYFALRETHASAGPFSVHALHLDTIRRHSRGVREAAGEHEGRVPLNPYTEEYGIGKGESPLQFVGAFDGDVANERLAAQEGLFLVASRIDLDYSAWLRTIELPKPPEPHGIHWIKYGFDNMTGSLYYDMVKQITQMGMSPIRLFPGLDGVCESFRFGAWFEVCKNLTPGD
jgi:hypothetical protein